ncbi:MAG: GNAT family N-acetyltransferase [Firmicutes bacterium]|nr:GNAT family N-acetyltransferase [Bacillota bacterium]
MIYFESKRLIFRDWKHRDLERFRNMNKDIKVMEYFPSILTKEETDNFLKKIKKEFNELGYGLYAVELKHNKEFIGYIGFHNANFDANFTPCIEIGWRLKYEAWGNGYATEGAKACLDYGFNKLKFDKIFSFTAKINIRSESVMKKIGMKKIGEFDHPNLDKHSPLSKHVLYFID